MPRGTKRAGGRRRGRPSMLASAPTAELRKELERRQAMLQEIVQQRDALNAELTELQGLFGGESKIIINGKPRRGPGRPPGQRAPVGSRRGRGGNKTNLVTALRDVLTGKTLSVSEVSDAVQKAGYKTTSPNFRTIVNQALISNPSVFKKVARGQYTAR